MRAVNLLPPDTRGASKASAELGAGPEATGGAGAFVVLGVLAACVAGVAGHVLTDNTIKQRQADLTEVTQRASRRFRARPTSSSRTPTSTSMAKARVQTVKDLAGSRFDWEQALRDLSRAIPADVTLKSLTGDISTGAGGGGSPLRSAIAAPAITIAGLRPRAARGRPPDGAPARHRRRHPRVAEQVHRRASSTRQRRSPASDATEIEQRNATPCGMRQASRLRAGHVLREGRRRGRHDPDDSARHRERDPPTPTPVRDADRPRRHDGATTTTTTTTQSQGGATP